MANLRALLDCRCAHGVKLIVALLGCLIGAALFAGGPALAALLPPQIHTVAGRGSCSGLMTSGGPCDGVAATKVPIDQARAVASLPGGGFLYVDSSSGLVREVSTSGTVTTVAGNGTTADAPDGTLAVNSGLNGPIAVAPLPSGGFLITEYDGSVIRVVSSDDPSTATIATVAGTGSPGHGPTSGSATSVALDYPTDAEPLADGRVLIADTYNNYIRVLSAAAPGATVSTIAGGGSCNDTALCDGMAATAVALNQPDSVSPIAGGTGGYLISEYATNSIREVSQSGTFTTVAGIPSAQGGYAGDGGPATSAQLNGPEQVVSTADGGFLIADAANEVVREVSAAGVITTVAGNGMETYAGDAGAATDASLHNPDGVAPMPDGGFLIADEDNGAIRRVTIAPTTTIGLIPAQPNASGWYNSPVTVAPTSSNGVKTNCVFDPPQVPTLFDEIGPCKKVTVTGDGYHTVYAASVNAFGDKELPVSITLKIDTTPPTLVCKRTPRFSWGQRKARVTATVSDQLSGPAALSASASVDTTFLGTYGVTVFGADRAGNIGEVGCYYTVIPAALKPRPALSWAFSAAGGFSAVSSLVMSDVPAGASVNITCHGGGCPFPIEQNVTGKLCAGHPCTTGGSLRRRRKVDLTPLLLGARLGVGDTLAVSVTEANHFGRVWVLKTNGGRNPSHRAGCLEPGSLALRRVC